MDQLATSANLKTFGVAEVGHFAPTQGERVDRHHQDGPLHDFPHSPIPYWSSVARLAATDASVS